MEWKNSIPKEEGFYWVRRGPEDNDATIVSLGCLVDDEYPDRVYFMGSEFDQDLEGWGKGIQWKGPLIA